MLERVAKYSLTIYEIQPICLAFILYNYYKSKVIYLHHMHTFSHDILKVLEIRIQPQFLFFMEKSILYAKNTSISQKNLFQILYYLYRPFIIIVTIMSQILINV